jgi:hypothetical protein
LGPEEIRSYHIYLAKERKVSVSSRTVATSALRFLYAVTLKQDRVIEISANKCAAVPTGHPGLYPGTLLKILCIIGSGSTVGE